MIGLFFFEKLVAVEIIENTSMKMKISKRMSEPPTASAGTLLLLNE